MGLCHNDVKIPVEERGGEYYVRLWYVLGYTDYCYPTKLAAEAVAMQLYPSKDSNSRVYYIRYSEELSC
jgi:hypothetical protein